MCPQSSPSCKCIDLIDCVDIFEQRYLAVLRSAPKKKRCVCVCVHESVAVWVKNKTQVGIAVRGISIYSALGSANNYL